MSSCPKKELVERKFKSVFRPRGSTKATAGSKRTFCPKKKLNAMEGQEAEDEDEESLPPNSSEEEDEEEVEGNSDPEPEG